MQDFTIFDMVVVGLTVILGLKGLFRGFIKEVLGLVGIIGGIFVASRFSLDVGNMIAPILGLESSATIKLIGFIATLVGFWLIVYIITITLNKITDISGLGAINRIFGFLFGSAKIFLIFSVIVYALYQVQSFKSFIDEKIGTSITFPYLVDVGGYIVKLDTAKISKNIENGVNSVVDKTKESINKSIQDKVSEQIDQTTTNTVNHATKIKEEVAKKIEDKKEKLEQAQEESSKNNKINTEENK
ncbi:CvpA family protein [Arcobacter sp. CECT 8985]|uniref:CvpA family protein n=1 Tax=Arcobacter sp. CECT 8985 TaxID=1935424 RepID=UPI00100C3118|nr:CvpA family protein [Arcobacter sp. CECT 8985]RXJ83336.1 colicin V synthesis protein [Arcobacter sp. CECT 8985]